MAKSVHGNYVVAFVLSLIVVYQSHSYDVGANVIKLNIEIVEELPVGTSVADLAVEAGLDSDRDALQFDVTSGSFAEYFTIGGETTRTSPTFGHLLIHRMIDRDVICGHRSARYVSLSVFVAVSFIYRIKCVVCCYS